MLWCSGPATRVDEDDVELLIIQAVGQLLEAVRISHLQLLHAYAEFLQRGLGLLRCAAHGGGHGPALGGEFTGQAKAEAT